MSSISRITRERLFEDEQIFNNLLPFAKFDSEFQLFVHADASLWSIWELQPQIITKTSDSEAFQLCQGIQEMLDSLEHSISCQVSWITTFDVEALLDNCLHSYPLTGPAGWMAKRWIKSLRSNSNAGMFGRRSRKMRLIIGFRYDPSWKGSGLMQQALTTIKMLLSGNVGFSAEERRKEYRDFASRFMVDINSKANRLSDMGFKPRRVDGQGLIDLLYPLLNRRSIKCGKFKRGKTASLAVPEFDNLDLLANQISDTPVSHPQHGIINKDGRYYRTISMVKSPKQCLPLMITPLQSSAFENILSVTFAKDTLEKQIARLDKLDTTLGLRERTGLGRSNQKILHQIRAIRTARQEIYDGSSQIVRGGVHQTFICQTEDEAVRAAAEGIALFPQLNGARGMVHEISDLGMMINSIPGCYDPRTDGAGWTTVLPSSRAVRMFPLWGNWRGSSNSLFVLPSLWNRELVGLDLYDSNVAPNTLISGVSGAGKSYLLCYILITMNRGHFATQANGSVVERQPITFVFDKGMVGQPCGFEKVAKLFNGRIYEATPSKAPSMNFLARLGNTPADARNDDYKDLIDMCSDIIIDMASETGKGLEKLDRGLVIESLIEAHRIHRNGQMRREFILADAMSVLRAPKRVEESAEAASRRQRIGMLCSDYYADGIYARFFDRPGSLVLKERFIVFDLKALSRNPDLQRVFLKVAMLWADTVMNDPKELDARKILVFDEAHDLIGKTSANTIETAFRLYRKRKGIVIAASQSGEDFYVGSGGQAIVQNSAHKIFLRQDPAKFHYTAQAFNLTEQQQSVILKLRTVKGIESQFYIISDLGEGALVLPLEPAFYWASTNNGDDNQLFADVIKQFNGEFWPAFEHVVRLAPHGAGQLHAVVSAQQAAAQATANSKDSNVSAIVASAITDASQSNEAN